jgi:hypothetical protein
MHRDARQFIFVEVAKTRRPRDRSQLMERIVDLATGKAAEPPALKKDVAAVETGRQHQRRKNASQ